MQARLFQSVSRVLPISLGAMALSHSALYHLVYPETAHRHHALATSGHNYFSAFTIISLFALAIALGLYIRSCQRAARKTKQGRAEFPFSQTLTSLFLLQSVIFITAEVGERLFSSGITDAIAFLGSSLFSFGIVLQCVAALVMSLLLYGTAVAIVKLTVRVSVAPKYTRQPCNTALTLRKLNVTYSHIIRGPPTHRLTRPDIT